MQVQVQVQVQVQARRTSRMTRTRAGSTPMLRRRRLEEGARGRWEGKRNSQR